MSHLKGTEIISFSMAFYSNEVFMLLIDDIYYNVQSPHGIFVILIHVWPSGRAVYNLNN